MPRPPAKRRGESVVTHGLTPVARHVGPYGAYGDGACAGRKTTTMVARRECPRRGPRHVAMGVSPWGQVAPRSPSGRLFYFAGATVTVISTDHCVPAFTAALMPTG